jgi:hypothetical protein
MACVSGGKASAGNSLCRDRAGEHEQKHGNLHGPCIFSRFHCLRWRGIEAADLT